MKEASRRRRETRQTFTNRPKNAVPAALKVNRSPAERKQTLARTWFETSDYGLR
jgi:hypothetical protein